MIGQTKLLDKFKRLINNNEFPSFTVLCGPKGSGKKTLIEQLTSMTDFNFIYANDLSVASVREIINNAYTLRNCCYVLVDADGMSVSAKNALLKITEEPPNNSYFIMTLEDINNTLPTIKSRATVFEMDKYFRDELQQYLSQMPKGNDANFVLDFCDTPGEINEILAAGPFEFTAYVDLVIDNIAEVSTANAFKIPGKVALKETDDGYDLRMFWKVFCGRCIDRAVVDIKETDTVSKAVRYLHCVTITSGYINKLRIKGINKQMLMDNWILDIREEWRYTKGMKEECDGHK